MFDDILQLSLGKESKCLEVSFPDLPYLTLQRKRLVGVFQHHQLIDNSAEGERRGGEGRRGVYGRIRVKVHNIILKVCVATRSGAIVSVEYNGTSE